MRIPQWKVDEVLKAYENGEIKQLAGTPASLSVPSRFFMLGITPRIVAEVMRVKKKGDDK